MNRAFILAIFCTATMATSSMGWALREGRQEPGPGTRIMGMIAFTSAPLTARLDLRFRPQLIAGVDTNADEHISEAEWAGAELPLRKRLRDEIELVCDGAKAAAVVSELKLLEGKLTETVVHYNITTTPQTMQLRLPMLKALKGLPPAQISVWQDGVMIKVPELVWFNRELKAELDGRTSGTIPAP